MYTRTYFISSLNSYSCSQNKFCSLLINYDEYGMCNITSMVN